MIVFENPGEIDIRAVTTLGVNAKSGDSPIGYFGTGLKYALAVLLREGVKVEIWSGAKRYSFRKEEFTFREKSFAQIIMKSPGGESPLGFTTEFGKNWTLANAYRELWSNCTDEQGVIYEDRKFQLAGVSNLGDIPMVLPDTSASFCPRDGVTSICVSSTEFSEVHDGRFGEILLPQGMKLVFENTRFQVFYGPSGKVYYRGIAAMTPVKPTIFTYNIKQQCQLTEDRTLVAGSYYLDSMLNEFVKDHAGERVVEQLLLAGETAYETTALTFSFAQQASENFIRGAEAALKRKPQDMNESAKGFLFRVKNAKAEKVEYPAAVLLPHEQEIIDMALERVSAWGYSFANAGMSCKVVESCGEHVLGLAIIPANECLIARQTLGDLDKLLGTLVEEWIHLRFKCRDLSHEMQNILVNEIVRLGYASAASKIPPMALPPSDDVSF